MVAAKNAVSWAAVSPALRPLSLPRSEPRRLRSVSHIRSYQVLADRMVERGADDDVHVLDRLGSEAGAARSAGVEELGVEPVEVLGVQ